MIHHLAVSGCKAILNYTLNFSLLMPTLTLNQLLGSVHIFHYHILGRGGQANFISVILPSGGGHTGLWSLGRGYLSLKFGKFENWLKVIMFVVKQHS